MKRNTTNVEFENEKAEFLRSNSMMKFKDQEKDARKWFYTYFALFLVSGLMGFGSIALAMKYGGFVGWVHTFFAIPFLWLLHSTGKAMYCQACEL